MGGEGGRLPEHPQFLPQLGPFPPQGVVDAAARRQHPQGDAAIHIRMGVLKHRLDRDALARQQHPRQQGGGKGVWRREGHRLAVQLADAADWTVLADHQQAP